MADTAVRITDDEAAILRAWLGGNRVQDIAKARRVQPSEVSSVLVELCDLNRDTARRILNADRAVAPVASFQQPAPAPPVESEPAPVEPTAGAPFGSYSLWACTACDYIGPDDDHGDDHPSGADLTPVMVTITRREADQ